MTGLHRPYIKPNTKPQYVHAKSNHPKSILKNIPANVNKRLSMLSSNEEVFNSSTKLHQEALKDSGYTHKLKFEQQDLNAMNKNKKKTRARRIHWFNPPWHMNVATNQPNRNINTRPGPKNPGTTLSHHIWELKDNNVPYNTKWSILSKASTFNPVTKKCRLCLKEVYYILYKPETATLNSRSEVFGWCKHRKQWSLKYT